MRKNVVLIYSKYEFHDVCEKYNEDPATAIISIEGTPECIKYYLEEDRKDTDNEHLLESSDTVLNLDFDDINGDEIEYNSHIFRSITKEQAVEVLEFVIKNLGKNIVVHCKAGRSRSQAVGRFILDYFPEEYEESKERPLYRTPNIHVLGKLKEAYYDRFGFGIFKPRRTIEEDKGKTIRQPNISDEVYLLAGLIWTSTGYMWVLISKSNELVFTPIEIPYEIISEEKHEIPDRTEEIKSILEIWNIKDDEPNFDEEPKLIK